MIINTNFKVVTFISSLFLFAACNSNNPTLDASVAEPAVMEKSPEELKRELKDIEFGSPLEYLTTTGTYRPTLFGNKMKVDLKIKNTATIASFKDVIIHFTYYSKTETEINSYDHTIYEIFPAGSTKEFEIKIENYADVKTINWSISKAIPHR